MSSVPSFEKIINICSELVAEGAKGLALDLLYSTLDHYVLKGKFDELSDNIEQLEPSMMETLIILGVFTHTCAWRTKLPGLRDFYERSEEWLRHIEPERWEGLLMGFGYE